MKIISLLFLLLSSNIIYAQDNGLSAFQFLRISPSPRASALGNSYTSIIGDSESIFYNPGALGFFKLINLPTISQILANITAFNQKTRILNQKYVFINGLCQLVFGNELSCFFINV